MPSPAKSPASPARFLLLAWLLPLLRLFSAPAPRSSPSSRSPQLAEFAQPARSSRPARLRPLLRLLPLPRRGGANGDGTGDSDDPGEDRNPWRCLRYPSMRWWSGANLVSNVGTWMQLTVQNLLVLQVTGSAGTTGLTVAVQAAPGLLLSLVGGAFVDSLPRKVTAAVSQAALGLVAFATAALVGLHMVNVPVLMVLAAVTGIIATIDNPACTLLGNDLVKSRDVPSAIALGSVVHSVGRLVGAAAAGGAVALFGLGSAYAVNGVSFLVVTLIIPFLKLVPKEGAESAAASPGTASGAASGVSSAAASGVLSRIRLALSAGAGRPAEPVWKRLKPSSGTCAGLVYFARNPRLVALTVVTGISAMFGRNYGMTLAVLVTGPLAGSAGSFGTVSTVLAVGGMIGALLAGCLRKPSVVLVGVLAAVGAGLQMFAGVAPSMLVLLILVAPLAVAESISDTLGTTVLQTDPPAHMRGRVLGVWRSASTGWQLAGPPLLGGMMETAGARGGLVLGGAVIIAVTLAGIAYQARVKGPVSAPAAVSAPGSHPAAEPAPVAVPAPATGRGSAPHAGAGRAPEPELTPAG